METRPSGLGKRYEQYDTFVMFLLAGYSVVYLNFSEVANTNIYIYIFFFFFQNYKSAQIKAKTRLLAGDNIFIYSSNAKFSTASFPHIHV